MVRIVEVGPRDGLQNEKTLIPTDLKVRFIYSLVGAGLNEIEAASFVSPKWVPQLADAADVWRLLPAGPKYSVLVPNVQGLRNAVEAGVDRIAVFTAASEAFVQKNINMSIWGSLEVFRAVVDEFRAVHPRGFVRGYVSTAFECPYSGPVTPEAVVGVVEELLKIGCSEICLGDTVGAASPHEVKVLARALSDILDERMTAWHFHDTRGTAIVNTAAMLYRGFRTFDSSAGGLGGCPYAPGAGGNLATEDLVYFLHREGVKTGIDLEKLALASQEILEFLGRAPSSKAQQAVLSACR